MNKKITWATLLESTGRLLDTAMEALTHVDISAGQREALLKQFQVGLVSFKQIETEIDLIKNKK